ncbi:MULTISPECIES: FAD-dependent oxidoreductase [Protofrankia]|uniref:FAD-dependent oxidoreductase n=1 Tax=Protofrankia TaxID=2994361 RepID=UPI0006407C8E|nr:MULTISPECIES: FAD-dependent oxidoreductase [Protofrankia]ONH33564.1 oxidoreductase [Protofrankia sp. BMG5.30]
MPPDTRHVLVVGAGVVGLLTALRCALAGHRVTVVDRGPVPNPVSSSFDQHRAIRALDPADRAATRRVAAAHHEWLALERLLGARLYRRVGVVTAWPAGEADAVAAAGADAGLPVELVEPDKLPHMRFPAGSVGVLEHDAGVLLARRVLTAVARWLDAHAAVTVLPWQDVVSVDADAGRVVLAGGRRLGADLVFVAAGPWSRELVDLPMVLYRQAMVYLSPPAELARWWERAPSAGRVGADGRSWLLPPGEGTLLKVSSSAVCREVDAVAGPGDRAADGSVDGFADGSDGVGSWPVDVDRLVASILTGPERYTVRRVRQCHYLVDAGTGGARLVRPGPAVWACAAAGGDGFRTAPLVAARIAAQITETTAENAVGSAPTWKEYA